MAGICRASLPASNQDRSMTRTRATRHEERMFAGRAAAAGGLPRRRPDRTVDGGRRGQRRADRAVRQSARAAQAARPSPAMSLPIIAAPPYALNLEHRIAKAPAAVHAVEAELMIVLDGQAPSPPAARW